MMFSDKDFCFPGCQHKFRDQNGTFASTNSSTYFYPDFQYCSWSIEVNTILNIYLKFLHLSIPHCKQNYLDIYDGTKENKTLLVRFCGENATTGSTVMSLSNALYIVLKTGNYSGDPNVSMGFSAKYQEHRGEILSMNFDFIIIHGKSYFARGKYSLVENQLFLHILKNPRWRTVHCFQ